MRTDASMMHLNARKHFTMTPEKHPEVKARECAVCKELFLPKKDWQKYCSPKCRNAQYWSTHKIVKIEPINKP